MIQSSPGTQQRWWRWLGWLNGGGIDEVLHGGRQELEEESGVYAGSGLDSFCKSVKTTTAKRLDTLVRLLDVVGCDFSRR